jgi:peptide/nickel transport system ATP-binding protein
VSQNTGESVRTAVGDTLLDAENLKKYYDTGGILSDPPAKAVDGVSLSIERGETVAIVGESGSGKTTLGRSLARLDEPTSGSVRFDGENIADVSGDALRAYRKRCQMVFQDPDSSLNDRMTVGEIIREPLDVHDWGTKPARRERVLELLDAVGLHSEMYARYPHQFSGGQRQRISIARALALEPDFLVLDEPVSALDVSVQSRILSLLADLQEEFGLTYLFITHDLGVVRHIADRVAVMYLGNVMERGPTESVLDDPSNPYTKALLSAIPEPDPHVDLDPVGLRGAPPDPRNPPSGCPFATRCPAKIHTDGLDPEAAMALDTLRTLLRERATATESVGERVRGLLGLQHVDQDIEAVRAELFDGIELPPDIESNVDDIFEAFRQRGASAAFDTLDGLFGSVCDTADPELLGRGDCESRCHRHTDDHDAVGDVR